jgi:adenylyl-sulfate kinase
MNDKIYYSINDGHTYNGHFSDFTCQFMQKLRERIVKSSRSKKHPGLVVWFTGLSGSGKSTLSKGLLALLKESGVVSCLLDGDIIRTGLCSDLGYSLGDRAENIRRVCEVCRLLSKAGVITLVAMISPVRADRERARAFFSPREFVEIFVDSPLELCEQRDVKGLYARARAGQIPNFTGISSPYEAPLRPDLQVDTAFNSYEASLKLVAECLLEFLPTVENP